MVMTKRSALLAISGGGLIAGSLDLLQACVQLGWDIPLYIAAGLLGLGAIHGKAGTWALGFVLHFFIAFAFATFYFLASRKLPFLKAHPLICGLYYGLTVAIVMNLIVLPVSGLHEAGPFTPQQVLMGFVQKMIVVGLPISFSVQRWG